MKTLNNPGITPFGCTDLSNIDLEETKGGNAMIPIVVAAGAYLGKKVTEAVLSGTRIVIDGPKNTTNVVNGVTNVVSTGFSYHIEYGQKK